MPQLKMLRGPEPGKVYSIQDEKITIGRGRRNEIIIHDNEVSREHCRLVRVLDVYEVHDLNSTNGTFVNGQQIDSGGWLLGGHHIIELGDSITLEFLTDSTSSLDESAVPIKGLADPISKGHYYLVIKRASQSEPEVYRLESDNIVLGRNLDNDIVLQEPEVSRHHITLSLQMDSEGYILQDMETLNGTLVNGNRLHYTAHLKNNDNIKIGTMVEMWYTSDPQYIEELLDDMGSNTRTSDIDDKAATRRKFDSKVPGLDTGKVEINVDNTLQPDDLLSHIFIAYDRAEWDKLVAHLFVYLQDNAVPVWVDQHLIPGSDDWNTAIEQARSESAGLIAVISEKSLQNEHVQRSIRHFTSREKPLLLLNAEEVEQLPMMIDNLTAIPFDPDDRERAFRTILAEISRLNLSGS
ncbi:MAG: FHA domain-containing protein [Aggregatilineales bacterium]